MERGPEADRLIEELMPWFLKTARGMTRREVMKPWAEDIAQIGAIAAFKAYLAFKPDMIMSGGDPANVKLWMRYRARMEMKTAVARLKVTPLLGQTLDMPTDELVMWGVHQDSFAGDLVDVQRAIKELPPHQQRYVVSRFWEGLRNSELGVSTGVWYGEKGARNRLRKRLREVA